jgi:hypothetical protein
MIPEQLTKRERDIRSAVAHRQYAGVPEQVEELRLAVDECLAGLAIGHPLRREIIQWSLATIQWARVMIMTQRQTWRGQAALLPQLGKYLKSEDHRPRGVCFDL